MSVEAARQRLSDLAPGYEEVVRGWAAWLSRRSVGADRARETLADAADLLTIDVDVRTNDGNRLEQLVKHSIKRLVGWYLFYLARQIHALGDALVSFGAAVVDRSDDLEDRLGGLERRVEQLERRHGGTGEG